MYHSFLIHSSADGHLGCFHVLAIINSAAMNIEGTRVSFPSGFLSVYAQQWIEDLNARPETIKLLEENIGKTLSNINHSRILYPSAALPHMLQLIVEFLPVSWATWS